LWRECSKLPVMNYFTRSWNVRKMRHWHAQAAGADAWHAGNKHIKGIWCMQVLWAWENLFETVSFSEIHSGCVCSRRKKISSDTRDKSILFCVITLEYYNFQTRIYTNTENTFYLFFFFFFPVFKLIFANDGNHFGRAQFVFW